MLYTVEQIFLQGVSFDIAYNELAHENMKKKYQYFLNSDVGVSTNGYHTHIYLSIRTLQIQIIS